MVKNISSKKAFTMIELLFAIVIIAISALSLPMMIQVTSKGIEGNIIQEAIFAASAQLNEATTYSWDEYSMNDLNDTDRARVVNTNTDGCTNNNNRPGNISRECLKDDTVRPYSDGYSPTYDDNSYSINSIAHPTESIFIDGSNPSSTDYKDDYNSSISVTTCVTGACTRFGDEANNPNLKQIEFQILDGDEVIILLRAYSANIGEPKLASKVL